MNFAVFRRRAISGMVLALGLACFGTVAAADAPAAVSLASFANGETISTEDLAQYTFRRIDLRQASRNLFGVQRIVQEMALTRALNLEGPSLGVEQRSEAKGQRFDDIYGQAVFTKLAPACAAPKDEAESRTFFDATPEAFRVPTMVRLQRIMLPRTGDVEGIPVAGWLLKQITDIGARKQTFEEAARQAAKVYNTDPQGDVGWVTLSDETPIMRALANVGEGDIVGPVPEGEFLYVFRVVAKHPARQLTWGEAKGAAAKRAVSYCREQTQKSIQAKMFDKYGVKINDKAIEAMFERGASKAQPTQAAAPAAK